MELENNKTGNAPWLIERLPKAKKIERRCEADYYGASYLIARALGLDAVPESLASWNHGISFWRQLRLPGQGLLTATQLDRCLVFNTQQEKFLRRQGFLRARAVGAPILYTPKLNVSRIKRSLLVMPSHTLFNTNPELPFDEYAQFIDNYRTEFQTIVACLHINDVRKGYWPAAFEKINIPWIAGADSHDCNSLTRMALLFCFFEFMTTNSLGSHIPYAAYFGCKVSVSGPIADHNQSDFRGVPWYDRNQKAVRQYMIDREKYLKGPRDPDFLVEPTEAVQHIKFAEKVLGHDCRRTPEEMARLLGWDRVGQLELKARKAIKAGASAPRRIFKKGKEHGKIKPCSPDGSLAVSIGRTLAIASIESGIFIGKAFETKG